MARNTDPASQEAGPYKGMTHRVCHNWILNSLGEFRGVVNHPIQGKLFPVQSHSKRVCQYTDKWQLIHLLQINVFWVIWKYITSPLGTRKCCKHFIKVEPKLISQNTLSVMAALILNNLIWLLKQLQSRHEVCKKHTLKNFSTKCFTNYQLLVNVYNQLDKEHKSITITSVRTITHEKYNE